MRIKKITTFIYFDKYLKENKSDSEFSAAIAYIIMYSGTRVYTERFFM